MAKNYMTRLERWARWMLPRPEAEDVIADYREITADPEMLRGLDKPRKVIRPLADTRAYRVWLAVFAVMAACILIPGASPHAPFWYIWDACFAGPYVGASGIFHVFGHWGPILAGLGLVVSLVWFRWQGHKEGRFPRAIPILLAVLLAWAGALLLVEWAAFRDPQSFVDLLGQVPLTWFGIPIMGGRMVPLSTQLMGNALQYGGTAAAILGVYALVKARIGDRRWAAVYCLSMAVMLASMESLAVFTSMDPGAFSTDNWWHAQMGYHLAILAVGAAGTGVALC